MKHTFSVLVENRAGVLSRIAGLFARRAFNIESLAVGVTEDPAFSRVTIVAEGSDYTVEQVEKQLNKLIDVIKVRTINPAELISRELVLIKVNAGQTERSDIMNIAEIMDAKILDISRATMTLELADTSERIDLFTELLRPFAIREIARTGTVALQKGTDTISVKK
ncbi:MAG: acetolactate synthase small subunit [Oscillospiraceae bacterium]|nr:acetolactate synthase small subunit [Oscillospiraceae bacterium]